MSKHNPDTSMDKATALRLNMSESWSGSCFWFCSGVPAVIMSITLGVTYRKENPLGYRQEELWVLLVHIASGSSYSHHLSFLLRPFVHINLTFYLLQLLARCPGSQQKLQLSETHVLGLPPSPGPGSDLQHGPAGPHLYYHLQSRSQSHQVIYCHLQDTVWRSREPHSVDSEIGQNFNATNWWFQHSINYWIKVLKSSLRFICKM